MVYQHEIKSSNWFEDKEGKTVTANQENYCSIIRKFCSSLSRRQGVDTDHQLFIQDSATPHTRDGTGQDFLDPTRPVNFKIIAG